MRPSGFIFDLDGVVWRGDAPIPGAREAIAALRERGLAVAFCTNNSTLHRRDVAAKLTRLGIPSEPEDVETSGSLVAALLGASEGAPPTLLIGEAGLRAELEEAGVPLVDEATRARWVVLGLDRAVTFERLRSAHRAILLGAGFLASNPDTLLPETDGGSCPGAGALTALLERSTGRSALCHGKPSPRLFERIAGRRGWDPREVVVVGDRLDTDMVAASRFGALGVLVLTGVTSRAEALIAEGEAAPSLVIESLHPSLLELAGAQDAGPALAGPGQ